MVFVPAPPAAFDDVQLDVMFSYGAKGGPQYRTVVVQTVSGAEQRIAQWPVSRRKWDISFGVQSGAQAALLMAFYQARGGRARGFRFQDPLDYAATNEPVTLLLDATHLQLTKAYVSGPTGGEVRTIRKPQAGTVTLFSGNAPLISGADYTLDYSSGVITLPITVPGAVPPNLVWTGQFDTPVRFDFDASAFNEEDFDTYSWTGINLIELLL